MLCIEILHKSEGSSVVDLLCAVLSSDSFDAGHKSLYLFVNLLDIV
jgi:hypothetical protein